MWPSIEQAVSLIQEDKKGHDVIKNTDILFIDEVSMVSSYVFEKAERVFREVRKEEAVFGNVQIILCGDFYQLRPVANRLLGDDGAYVFQRDVFEMCVKHKVELSEVHRERENPNLYSPCVTFPPVGYVVHQHGHC